MDSLFIVTPILEYVIGLCLLYVSFCPFKFCNHLDGEERAGCSA